MKAHQLTITFREAEFPAPSKVEYICRSIAKSVARGQSGGGGQLLGVRYGWRLRKVTL